uniref:Mitochondrial cardiolipin hydrolase n=1 Tax=Chlamydomonas leiostraca TaxID=1034604 RepID=A0A7S0WPJ2_9CHLO|mmetsp:Transcript_219/g.508  ORF Transcript_219/g.508 Transcript_219/m.508 type:complete len:233 (+) Transcript_219:161-859(+)|eukprot:CAMPEP_0202862294 /NCGR_PEP_ID=MMETSP1391-20130828/3386_1 /ASSEMBLY_ACC=CAM_ASM_000867 /TAXON_ID=1034604 /ORGANISM="Chlamydomonas leiostraca, Strain SAG 11-49" /LENGTH=232 /DNA_ID=CAMNT_0049541809 /DNA_START=161 /DNA_END=859 /DNA_ORIENTATION=-
MGGCLSTPEQGQGGAVKYAAPPPGQQGYYPPVPNQTYAAAAGAGIPPPGQWPHPAAAGGAGYTICKALFFPDPALPCHNARKPGGCRRHNCNFAHQQTSLTQLLDVIASARQSLIICVFTITCDEISDVVIGAHKRGIKVRVISDDDQAKTQGSDVARMQQAGIPVKVDHQPTHMHHKFCVVDGRVLINGSFNWTRQAVIGNNENVVILDIPSLVAEFSQYFEALWAKFRPL